MHFLLVRRSAADQARSFIYTPEKKPVNVHQFYPDIANDYEVQVSKFPTLTVH